MKNNITHAPLILGSASPRRLDLLRSIQIEPAHIIPTNIDETPRSKERPRDYALRMAIEKNLAVPTADNKQAGHFILTADTVVACGSRILPKAETEADARYCLELLRGRRHRVWGGICLRTPDDKLISRVVCSVVKFKNLNAAEIDAYIASHEWNGKAGGYGIQGLAAAFIPFISGSYSNIVGLSLSDTHQILSGNKFFN